jgi:hypothetical protein
VKQSSSPAAEKSRALQVKEQAKALGRERAKIQAMASAAGSAIDELRRKFVPIEVRNALRAAGRAEREAQAEVNRASSDLIKARESLQRVKERVRTVPSQASANDLRELVKREEELLASHEAAEAQAHQALEQAKAAHVGARMAFDAAMSTARAQ